MTPDDPFQQWQSQEVTPTAVVSSTGYELLTEPLLRWARSVMHCGVPNAEGRLLQCCAKHEQPASQAAG